MLKECALNKALLVKKDPMLPSIKTSSDHVGNMSACPIAEDVDSVV